VTILYHWEPNGASARTLIALYEKGVPFETRYVDLPAFEQFGSDFLALDPAGDVPVLVQDGAVFTDASALCEYIDEAFAGPPLLPSDPLGRWKARGWQKYVDDYLAAATSELAWAAYGHEVDAEGIDRIPTHEQRSVWREALAGYDDARLKQAEERVTLALGKADEALADAPWLAGDSFTLADIASFAYLNYAPRLLPGLVGARTADWLRRVAGRPATSEALGMGRAADPFAIAAPGPERVRWG